VRLIYSGACIEKPGFSKKKEERKKTRKRKKEQIFSLRIDSDYTRFVVFIQKVQCAKEHQPLSLYRESLSKKIKHTRK